MYMGTDNIKHEFKQEWSELRSKIKAKWSKLVDTDLDSFKDNLHLIADKVQKVYGVTKDKAEQEYKDFRKTLEEKTH